MDTSQDPSLRELWLRTFNHVRDTVEIATVWLAMQAAVPIVIDGPYFIAGLPVGEQYLASNLLTHEATAAIEESLQQLTGRILAFRLIEGTTLEDWHAQKSAVTGEIASPAPNPEGSDQAPLPAPPLAAGHEGPASPPSPDERVASQGARAEPQKGGGREELPDPAPSWEKLNERLVQAYKTSPVKYVQGQARFLMRAVRQISDTMDILMPVPGQPPDDIAERALTRCLERLGSVINLDPLFIALEVMRYRQGHDKETF